MAQVDKNKPELTGNSFNNFTTPTLEELQAEYRQADEALKKRRGEEYLQEYVKCLPPCSNHVGPSTLLRQDKKEDLQANQQKRIHSANIVDSVETGLSNGMFKAECVASCQPSASFQMSASPAKAECIKPTIAACTKIEDASLAEQRNDKHNKLVVLNFSGCKGAYMLPYEFLLKIFMSFKNKVIWTNIVQLMMDIKNKKM